MNLQKKMSEKQVASNFKPEEEFSNVNFPLQSHVAGIERTSSYAEDTNLEIEFSDLSISSTVSPEILPSVLLKSNVLENHSIDFDQRQKIVLSTDTDKFPAITDSDYEILSKNVEKYKKIQTTSFVDSNKKHGNGSRVNYLKNDDCLNSPKSQSSVCFLSPSLTNRELIAPTSADKSTPYIVRIRKIFYDDALLPSAKTNDNEEFIRHLIQKENEAGFEQNDSGSSMEDKSFNTSDDMFSYSREENISGGSSNISGVQSGIITKDSSHGRSYLENLSYCDKENSANFSGELYYTPCKDNSNFMQKGGLFRYIGESIFGESSIIREVDSDKILKDSPSYFLENQAEEVTYTVKEVKSDMDNTNSQSLIHENTAGLAEEMSRFSTEQNNAFIDSQAKTGKILNGIPECHLENETYLDQEETTASKKIESDIMNPSSSQSLILENSANLAGKLYHSTPEKHKSDESSINSGDKMSKILNVARLYRLKNEGLLNEEETSSTVEKQIDFIQLEVVDMEKVTDKCIDEIITDTHPYNLKKETNKEEMNSIDGKQVDFIHPEITTVQKIMGDCNNKIIDNKCQCDLKNEISFDERENIPIKKIEYDTKNAYSKSLISENFANLVGEYHSTPKNKSDDSIINSDCETSKISNLYEYDSEIEAFLKNEAMNLTEEKEIYFIRPEMQKSMDICTNEAYLCKDNEDTFITFSNIFDLKTSEIMNELQQEWQETANKVERNEIEQFIAEQVFSQSSIQENRHLTGVCEFHDTKRNSNEFTHVSEAQNNISIKILPKQNEENKQAILKKDEKLSKENVLRNFMQETHASGLGDYAIERDMYSALSSTSRVVSEIVVNRKRKLRPRKKNIDLFNENLSRKRKANFSKSPVEVFNDMSGRVRGSSSAEITNNPVKMEIETENAEDRNSKSNVIYYANDIEAQNEIRTANLIQNQREVKKVCSAQTLFDLFSIDKAISMGTLKGLSSKELRSGALFIQIIRFLRQEIALTINSKIKEDAKKFLTAAMDAGWIEKKSNRYKLIGDANLVDNKKQTKPDVTKRAKISQPKKQAKVRVSKRTKIPQSKKQEKAPASKITKIKQPKNKKSKSVGDVNLVDDEKQATPNVTKGVKISQPKNQAKAAANKAMRITQPKNQESKSVGDANLFDNKRQTRSVVTKDAKIPQLKKQAKTPASKVMRSAQPTKQAKAPAISVQPKNLENKSVGKVNLIDVEKQTKNAVTHEEDSQPKKQAKAVVCKRKKNSQPKQEVKDTKKKETRSKRRKVSQPNIKAEVTISKGKQTLLPKQQAKDIMTKGIKISQAKMQLRNQR